MTMKIYKTEKVHGNVLNEKEKKKKIRYYDIRVQLWDVYWMETSDNHNRIQYNTTEMLIIQA